MPMHLSSTSADEEFDAIIHRALKEARDAGASMMVELFEVFVEEGMCADCCLREAKRVLASTSYKPPEQRLSS